MTHKPSNIATIKSVKERVVIRMKDKLAARFRLIGAGLSGSGSPIGKKLGFAESKDIKNSLAVTDGENTVGYVTGSEAALIKTLLARGVILHGVCPGTAEQGEAERTVLEVYFTPKRI